MRYLIRTAVLYLLPVTLFLPAWAASVCENGSQSSGAVYRICMPAGPWNGDLILFAHGYVVSTAPIAIPEAQLTLPDGTSVPDLVTGLGYAFATTSFSQNGLAVPQGVADIVDLVNVFRTNKAQPRRVFVTGVSEGALVAVKAMEGNPGLFNGGLAACGPIGDFRRQLDYVGDTRVVFDYFFPGVLPASAIDIPTGLMTGWNGTYEPLVLQKLQQRPLATAQLLSVAKVPIGLNPGNAGDAVTSVLWYNVFATNDAIAKLGGNPFDNKNRWYSGSLSDLLLNLRVARFQADSAALAEVQAHYQTTGQIVRPLVTLHTTADPVVPYWHETLYAQKAAASHDDNLLIQLPVFRYGHCNFTSTDVLVGFLLLVLNPQAQ
jgi:hypothetical protein